MAGPLTNTAIAGVIFGIVLTFGIYMLGQFSLGYEIPIESNFTDLTGYNSAIYNATAVYDNASQGATINTQSVGSAQLQGLISAEQTKIGFIKVLSGSISDFFKYFPVLSYMTTGLIVMLGIISISMIYRAIRGVDP